MLTCEVGRYPGRRYPFFADCESYRLWKSPEARMSAAEPTLGST
jgi:hypothetical protein